MTDLRKAAEKALEFIVLASSKDRAWFTEKEFEVVAALRKALAQPEQEPSKQFHEWACAEHQKILAESANSTTSVVESKVLAQPEQEPLAWINKNEVANIKAMAKAKCTKEWQTNLGLEPEVDDVPLYTAPPKREFVGLTKEDIKEGVNASRLYEDQFEPVALWVEAKLKEKNSHD